MPVLDKAAADCELQPLQLSGAVPSCFYDWCLMVTNEPDTVISSIISLYCLFCKSCSAFCQLHLEV